jgi:hypothetical protein
VSSCEAKRTAGWRFGGFRRGAGVVSMMRNLVLSMGEVVKIDLSSMLRRSWRVGSAAGHRFHVSWRDIGPEVASMPLDVVSVGPVTRRMASKTSTNSSLLAFLPTTV